MVSKWILLLCLTGIQAQDPRKRLINSFGFEEMDLNKNEEDISCSLRSCVKRSSGQDELGPFWANRGKKDPTYLQDRLYVDEPHWILVRRDDTLANNQEPFFITRGKKEVDNLRGSKYFWKNINGVSFRDRRDYTHDNVDSPFFAARGKRSDNRHIEKI